ncbi:uncharacterized protein [Ptychodera flava]|uniref:uncharacterized protein n=1 Tax=Ptychodera flava TaxID=63121 RepID=UPI00396AA27C
MAESNVNYGQHTNEAFYLSRHDRLRPQIERGCDKFLDVYDTFITKEKDNVIVAAAMTDSDLDQKMTYLLMQLILSLKTAIQQLKMSPTTKLQEKEQQYARELRSAEHQGLSPFSVLLEMITLLYKDADAIQNCLRVVYERLTLDDDRSKPNPLVAKTICKVEMTLSNGLTKMFWGASVARERKLRKTYLRNLVNQHFHEWVKGTLENENAFIKFPMISVRCVALQFSHGEEIFTDNNMNTIPPCQTCSRLFQGITWGENPRIDHERIFPPGNCAEYYAFSKLLRAVGDLQSWKCSFQNGTDVKSYMINLLSQ